MTTAKDLAKLALGAIEIKIDLKELSHGLIDDVLEPALQKVVDDSANPFDNAAMSMLYPILEGEIKKLIDAKVAELEAAIAKKIEEIKA